jgi:hypothetical protein
MGFGDRDDRRSVKAHLRAKAHAKEMSRLTKEMSRLNKWMRELEADDAAKRGGILSRVMRLFHQQGGHANGLQSTLLAFRKVPALPACPEKV